MGLDIYLEGEKHLWPDFRNPQNIPQGDGYPLKTKTFELGYRRKHPNLHGYIVGAFADADNCQAIALEAGDIEKIIDAVARNNLPHTEGFFFGQSAGTAKESDLKTLRASIKWLRTEDCSAHRTLHYRASW